MYWVMYYILKIKCDWFEGKKDNKWLKINDIIFTFTTFHFIKNFCMSRVYIKNLPSNITENEIR